MAGKATSKYTAAWQNTDNNPPSLAEFDGCSGRFVPGRVHAHNASDTISTVMKPQRREFLQALAAGAAALSIPRAGLGETSAATKLADKVTLVTGAGNNVVVLAGGDDSLLVDCGDAAHAPDLLKHAGRVKTVFNTHWHTESTGANDAMAKAGAKLTSHVNTELWMTQEIIHDWEKKVSPRVIVRALPSHYGRLK